MPEKLYTKLQHSTKQDKVKMIYQTAAGTIIDFDSILVDYFLRIVIAKPKSNNTTLWYVT